MKEKYINYAKKYCPRLDNKTILVTGSTGGLGESLVEYLVMLGATLILPVRNPYKLDSLKNKLLEKYPGAKIYAEYLDFEDFKSIDNIPNILSKYPKLDYVFSNIGGMGLNNKEGEIDRVTKINAFGTLYFTEKIVPFMNKDSKILTTTSQSIEHKGSYDFTNYDFKGDVLDIYSNSKKLLTQSLLYMSKEIYKDQVFELVHPGATATQLFGKSDKRFVKIFYPLLKAFFHSKDKAALSLLAGIYMDTKIDEWVGPKGFKGLNGYPRVYKLVDRVMDEHNWKKAYLFCQKYIEIIRKDVI